MYYVAILTAEAFCDSVNDVVHTPYFGHGPTMEIAVDLAIEDARANGATPDRKVTVIRDPWFHPVSSTAVFVWSKEDPTMIPGIDQIEPWSEGFEAKLYWEANVPAYETAVSVATLSSLARSARLDGRIEDALSIEKLRDSIVEDRGQKEIKQGYTIADLVVDLETNHDPQSALALVIDGSFFR